MCSPSGQIRCFGLFLLQLRSLPVSIIQVRPSYSPCLKAVIAYSEYDLIVVNMRINRCLHGCDVVGF